MRSACELYNRHPRRKGPPPEAITLFHQGRSFDGKKKKCPLLTTALGLKPTKKVLIARLSATTKAKYEGKDEHPRVNALENINQVVDRMIDAYARAVALLPGTTPDIKAKSWDAATFYYKVRHDKRMPD